MKAFSDLFKLARESTGLTSATENKTSHAIAINSSVIDSQLQISWNYSSNYYHEQTMINLAEKYIKYLQEIIIHCQTSIGGHTPSDFSLTELKQDTINSIANMVSFDD